MDCKKSTSMDKTEQIGSIQTLHCTNAINITQRRYTPGTANICKTCTHWRWCPIRKLQCENSTYIVTDLVLEDKL